MPRLSEEIEVIERETRAVFGEHNARMVAFVTAIGQTDQRPQPGTPAPDFALPNADGALVSLSDLMGPRGLVLMFIRGLWCPYCNAQMRAFEESVADLAAAGLCLAVITPEVGGRAAETKATLGLSCEVVCDVDEGVALAYGCLIPLPQIDQEFLSAQGYDLTQLYGNGAWFLPLASLFLISADGVVRAVLGGADQCARPGPEAVLAAAGDLAPGA